MLREYSDSIIIIHSIIIVLSVYSLSFGSAGKGQFLTGIFLKQLI